MSFIEARGVRFAYDPTDDEPARGSAARGRFIH